MEDSPDNQYLVRSYLKSTPYQVDVAEHGGVAVEQFKQGHYDVILMDMNMPVMDGYEATRVSAHGSKSKIWLRPTSLP